MKVVQPEAAPFFFNRGKVGCLLIHGLIGAPAAMRWLGEQLAMRDYSTLGVRLFGHGTDQNDLLRAKWRDWYLSAVDGYHLLSGQCDHIIVIGFSLGGILSFLLGAEFPFSGIVSLSTSYHFPVEKYRRYLPLLPILSKVWRFKSKEPSDWVDPDPERDHIDYPQYPLIAGHELDLALREMRMSLPRITAPTLIIHSKRDRSISMDHPKRIFAEVGAEDKQLIWLEQSGHVVTRDAEKGRVLEEIDNFIHRVLSDPDQGRSGITPRMSE